VGGGNTAEKAHSRDRWGERWPLDLTREASLGFTLKFSGVMGVGVGVVRRERWKATNVLEADD
jgi:hypothetical protein